MNIKKILKYLLLTYLAYILVGVGLLRFEQIQEWYFLPYYKIQYGGEPDKDQSTVSSDGPIVVNKNGKLISYSILPKDTTYITSINDIQKKDTLKCYVDEIKQVFQFTLKDSLRIEQNTYILPTKMLIISDIEGNFKGFKSILNGTNVIDKNLNWTFGQGHLVLVGDFFDRGVNVTECLWLIYKLEQEAELKGGKVHFILGNHEVMNMKEKYKYVRDKYWDNSDTLKLDYEEWYSTNSELGKWLRTKNGVEKIGDFLFAHAGISKDFSNNKFTLTQINDNIRKSIDKVFKDGEAGKDIFIGNESPLWYRGIVEEDESQQDIEQTLKSFNASKMIVGHTIVDKIKYLYNQRIIAIDLEHKENSDNNKMFGLWYENGNFSIIDNNGTKTTLK